MKTLSELLKTLPKDAYSDAQKAMLEKAAFKGFPLEILVQVAADGHLSYDAEQMYSIIMGYEGGINVSVYSVLQEDGTPVYTADMMEEIRLAMVDGVDIRLLTKRDERGCPIYSDRMMWLIHEAFMYGFDYALFSEIRDGNAIFNDAQACEIFLGEKAGVDYAAYAVLTSDEEPKYSADDMRSMRQEMEQKIAEEYSYINSRMMDGD